MEVTDKASEAEEEKAIFGLALASLWASQVPLLLPKCAWGNRALTFFLGLQQEATLGEDGTPTLGGQRPELASVAVSPLDGGRWVVDGATASASDLAESLSAARKRLRVVVAERDEAVRSIARSEEAMQRLLKGAGSMRTFFTQKVGLLTTAVFSRGMSS